MFFIGCSILCDCEGRSSSLVWTSRKTKSSPYTAEVAGSSPARPTKPFRRCPNQRENTSILLYTSLKMLDSLFKAVFTAQDGYAFNVTMASNSVISNFNFNESLKQIRFNITGPTGWAGYCNVTIPKRPSARRSMDSVAQWHRLGFSPLLLSP